MTKEDWNLFQKTYQNTVSNSFTPQVKGAKVKPKHKKKVRFSDSDESSL